MFTAFFFSSRFKQQKQSSLCISAILDCNYSGCKKPAQVFAFAPRGYGARWYTLWTLVPFPSMQDTMPCRGQTPNLSSSTVSESR